MDALKIADFAISILFYAAAGAVIQVLRTILYADKFMLRQSAVVTAPAGSKEFFHQPVASGTLFVGFGKEHPADALVYFFPAGNLKRSGFFANGRFIKRIITAQNPVVYAVVV